MAGKKQQRTDNTQHLDEILRTWPFDPEGTCVRKVSAGDGREVIQMRLDLGVLQLETTGRPDGKRPEGSETYFDHLLAQSLSQGRDFQFSAEQCEEADREFLQFYQRRICWLMLHEYQRAIEDADHTLAFMDLCKAHSPQEEWTLSHEQYRPFVLFHRTQAAALRELEQDGGGAEKAIQEINAGLDRIKAVFEEYDAAEEYDEDELVKRLIELRESLREQFAVGRTLNEQLADAIESEQYELAARLRDQIANQTRGH